jgi:hypothetical protein
VIHDLTLTEGSSGGYKDFNFSVEMLRNLGSLEPDIRIPVYLGTDTSVPSDQRATIGNDVQSQGPQYLTFKNGESTLKEVKFRIYQDSSIEVDERFKVTLGTPKANGTTNTYGIRSDGRAIGTITNDDSYVGTAILIAVQASNGFVDGGTAFFDANRNGIIDFLDLNSNGVQEPSEPDEPTATTAADGTFQLAVPIEFDLTENGAIDAEEGNVVVLGGIDTGTMLPIETRLAAPGNSSVVTPLTTIAVSMIEGFGQSTADSELVIRQYFGLADSVNLFGIDAVTETAAGNIDAPGVEAAVIEANDTAILIARLLHATSGIPLEQAARQAFDAIAEEILGGADSSELGQTNVVRSLIDTAATSSGTTIDPAIATGVAEVIAAGNLRIRQVPAGANEDFLREIKKVQAVELTQVAADIERAAAGLLSPQELIALHTGEALDDQIDQATTGDILPVQLSISDSDLVAVQQSETVTQNFTVSLSEPSTQIVRVQYRAIVPTDSELPLPTIEGELEFSPGETSMLIGIPVTPTNVVDGVTPYFVELFDPQHAVIADAIGQPIFDGPAQIVGQFAVERAVTAEDLIVQVDFVDLPGQTHTARIDWGDGKVDEPVVVSVDELHSISGSHAYDQPGSYAVQVRLTDDLGNIASVERTIVVERWLLADDPENPGKQVLTIGGTSGKDDIDIRRKSRNQIEVKVKGGFKQRFDGNQISRLVIHSGDRDDKIKIQHRLDYASEIHAGAGNDTVRGGRGSDLIFGDDGNDNLEGNHGDDSIFGGDGQDRIDGGSGNDQLFGNDGNDNISGGFGDDMIFGGEGEDDLRDWFGDDALIGGDGDDSIRDWFGDNLIVGGRGGDELRGGWGSDLLIAGRTIYDDDVSAIDAIMAEWTSNRPYGERVSKLRSGVGDPTVQLDNGTSVLDDDDADNLSGGFGLDWYFHDPGNDRIKHLGSGEETN